MATGDLPDKRPMDLDSYSNTYDYSVWRPQSEVTLCNVPWDSTYRDVVRFDNAAARDAYFNGLDKDVTILTRQTMVRFGEPVRIAMPFDKACKYNYLRVTYGRAGNSRPWYYFVQDVKWLAGGVTELYLMLDVWTSFQFDITFGRCYVERGHVGVARQISNNGDYNRFLSIPEGLDVGSHYYTMQTFSKTIYSIKSFSAVIVSTVNLNSKWPTASNADDLESATGSDFQDFPSGTETYVLPAGNVEELIFKLSKYPLVSQGIVSIMLVPKIDINDYNIKLHITENGLADIGLYILYGRGKSEGDIEFLRIKNFREHLKLPDNDIFAAMTNKMTVSPYSVIEITLYNGSTLIINPENILGDDLVIRRMTFYAQPSPRAVFYVSNYNKWGTHPVDDSVPHDSSFADDFLDTALVLDNFPTTNVVNNSTIAYMTSNRSSIRWQYQNADWSQQKTQLGIQQAQAQTAQGNQFRNQNTAQKNSQMGQRTLQHNVEQGISGATSAAGNLLSGNIGGALSTAVGTGENIVFNSLNNSQEMRFNTANTRLANSQATQANDLNTQYATQAMNGDYQNQIAGINAKVQDAKLLEPSVSGQVGGDAFNFSNGIGELVVKFKRMQTSAELNILNYWSRYGYAVQRFMTPPTDLQVMSNATYWKMSETYLSSSTCPEPYRQTIRGIFEKGVTVYKYPGDIGHLNFSAQKPIMKAWYD